MIELVQGADFDTHLADGALTIVVNAVLEKEGPGSQQEVFRRSSNETVNAVTREWPPGHWEAWPTRFKQAVLDVWHDNFERTGGRSSSASPRAAVKCSRPTP